MKLPKPNRTRWYRVEPYGILWSYTYGIGTSSFIGGFAFTKIGAVNRAKRKLRKEINRQDRTEKETVEGIL